MKMTVWNELCEACDNLCRVWKELYDSLIIGISYLSYTDYVNWILSKKHYGKTRKYR